METLQNVMYHISFWSSYLSVLASNLLPIMYLVVLGVLAKKLAKTRRL